MSPSEIRLPKRRTAEVGAIRAVACILIGSALLAAAAHIAVPFWPVPITLQTLAVLGLGVAFGPKIAAASAVAYLAEGLVGLPVFAHGAGLAALAGPTGGYLVGFIPAAWLTGAAARRGWLSNPASALAAFAAADAVIFAVGVTWLATLVGGNKAIVSGLVPFLLGEALKLALLTAATQVRSRAREA